VKNLYTLINNHPWLARSIDIGRIPATLSIKGLTASSSLCQKDFLFVAVKKATPTSRDGHDFIDEAISNGATIVFVDVEYKQKKTHAVPLIFVTDTKTALCHLAEAFYNFPSHHLHVIGITGTNGKTSTSFMLHSILQQAGFTPKIMGTLGLGDPQNLLPTSHTTMEPEFISASLDQMKSHGASHVIMEVSSHALSLKRTEAIKFAAVGLTNITEDHLDLHGSVASYQEAKSRLFFELADKDTRISLPDAHPFGARVQELKHLQIYGGSSRQLSFSDIHETHEQTSFVLHANGQNIQVDLPFLGDFHVKNASLAASMALGLGISLEHIVLGLKKCPTVPGRLEPVHNHHALRVFVDFAHTPDGLLSLLTTIKKLEHQKIILVFGCGGNRDRSKRPIMGEIAEKYADIVIVTDDNPRNEKPDLIRLEILKGMKKSSIKEIPDRRKAIQYAIINAQKNDIVVIAGKGHEAYQIYGDTRHAFSDTMEARRVLDSL
jgi:UDP-N-acetylmuramoyl-L-alanyl-D-glutamate--2,6-diaminopimelate ligase